MFNFFKKKSEAEVLRKKYTKVMEEAYELSKVNRTKSDSKYAEAELLMDQIKRIQEK